MTRPTSVYDDRPRTCPVCAAPFPGFHAYWDHAETTHGWVWRNGKIVPPDDEQIGVGRSALYLMGIWPTAAIHRDTLRTLASVNRGTGSRSREKLVKSIRTAETDGLLKRDGDWVHILDGPALYARAIDRMESPTHHKFLALNAAIPVLAALIRAERDAVKRAKRERELAFIRSLMNPYAGRVPGKGRSARVVAAGRIA